MCFNPTSFLEPAVHTCSIGRQPFKVQHRADEVVHMVADGGCSSLDKSPSLLAQSLSRRALLTLLRVNSHQKSMMLDYIVNSSL